MSKKKIFEIGKKVFGTGRKKPRRKPKAQIKKGDKSIVFDITKGSKAKSALTARKGISDEAGDITQPADTSSLTKASKLKANDPGKLSTPQKVGGKRAGVQRAVNKDKRKQKQFENKINKLKESNNKIKTINKELIDAYKNKETGKTVKGNEFLIGVSNNKKLLKNNTDDIKALEERVKLIKTRVSDMISKNPVVKKAGGKIVARKTSGKVGKRKAGCKAGQGKAMRGF